MVISHCYVSSPEGIPFYLENLGQSPLLWPKKQGTTITAQEIATTPEFAGWHYPGCIMMQRMERMDIYI